jgi:hypothetical protein
MMPGLTHFCHCLQLGFIPETFFVPPFHLLLLFMRDQSEGNFFFRFMRARAQTLTGRPPAPAGKAPPVSAADSVTQAAFSPGKVIETPLSAIPVVASPPPVPTAGGSGGSPNSSRTLPARRRTETMVGTPRSGGTASSGATATGGRNTEGEAHTTKSTLSANRSSDALDSNNSFGGAGLPPAVTAAGGKCLDCAATSDRMRQMQRKMYDCKSDTLLDEEEATRCKIESQWSQQIVEVIRTTLQQPLKPLLKDFVDRLREMEESLGGRDGEIAALLLKNQTTFGISEQRRLQVEQLQLEVSRYRKELTDSEDRNRSLEKENGSLKQHNEGLQERLTELHSMFDKRCAELEQKRKECTQLLQAQASLSENLDRVTSNAEETSKNLLAVSRAADSKEHLIHELKRQQEEFEIQLNEQKEKVEFLSKQLSDKDFEISQGRRDVSAAEEKLLALINQGHLYVQEIESLKSQLASKENSLKRMGLEIQEVHSKAADHQGVVDGLKKTIRDLTAQLESSRTEVNKWEGEANRLEKELELTRGQWSTGMGKEEWYAMASLEASAIIKPLQEAWQNYGLVVKHVRQQFVANVMQLSKQRAGGGGLRLGVPGKKSKTKTDGASSSSGLSGLTLLVPDGSHQVRVPTPSSQQGEHDGDRRDGSATGSQPDDDSYSVDSRSQADTRSHRGGTSRYAPSEIGREEANGMGNAEDQAAARIASEIDQVFKHLVTKDYELRKALISKKKKQEELTKTQEVIEQLNDSRQKQHEEYRESLFQVLNSVQSLNGYDHLIDEVFEAKKLVAQFDALIEEKRRAEALAEQYHVRCSVLERHLEEAIKNPNYYPAGGASNSMATGGATGRSPSSPSATGAGGSPRGTTTRPHANSGASKSSSYFDDFSKLMMSSATERGSDLVVAVEATVPVSRGATPLPLPPAAAVPTTKPAVSFGGLSPSQSLSRPPTPLPIPAPISTHFNTSSTPVATEFDQISVPTLQPHLSPASAPAAIPSVRIEALSVLAERVSEANAVRTHLLELENSSRAPGTTDAYRAQILREMQIVHERITPPVSPRVGGTTPRRTGSAQLTPADDHHSVGGSAGRIFRPPAGAIPAAPQHTDPMTTPARRGKLVMETSLTGEYIGPGSSPSLIGMSPGVEEETRDILSDAHRFFTELEDSRRLRIKAMEQQRAKAKRWK